LATAMFAQVGWQGDFLGLKETRMLFRKEQHFPSAVIDRGLLNTDGSPNGILDRARQRIEELLAGYERPTSEREQEMIVLAEREGKKAGLAGLPGILRPDYAPAV